MDILTNNWIMLLVFDQYHLGLFCSWKLIPWCSKLAQLFCHQADRTLYELYSLSPLYYMKRCFNKTRSKMGFVKNKSAFSVPFFYMEKCKLWKNLRVCLCDRCFNWHLLHCCSWLEFHLEILEKKQQNENNTSRKWLVLEPFSNITFSAPSHSEK